jgi:CRP-like cAMP-binding protein
MDLMRKVPLFAGFSKGELAQVARVADELDVLAGKELIREGTRGREFFLLVDGEAVVRRKGRRIGTMQPGDFFGEIALVANTPRTATVTTSSPARVLVLTDRAFRRLLDERPQMSRKVLQAFAERLAPTTL